ncbi:MAG: hypothetical protein IJ903_01915 [Ruminococcus sp.]|nr:hypothetical protein [Ruminococcus sp.]
MSTKERIINLIDGLSESQLNGLLQMLTGYVTLISDKDDDAYCAELYEEYVNDSDENKNDNISIEEFSSELGIAL